MPFMMSRARLAYTSPTLMDAPFQISAAVGPVPVAAGLSGAVKSTFDDSARSPT